MGYIILSFIFSYGVTFVLQFVFSVQESSSLFAALHAILSLSIYALFILNAFAKKIINRRFLCLVLLLSLIIIGYSITPLLYRDPGLEALQGYDRYFKYLFINFIPSILLGVILYNNKHLRLKVLNAAPPFSYAMTTVLGIIVALKSLKANVANDFNYSGLTYQAISYYLMYMFAILEFVVIAGKKIEGFYFKNRFFVFLNLLIMLVQSALCVVVGGRGGIVLMIVLYVVGVGAFLYSQRGTKSYSLRVAFLCLLLICLIPVILFFLQKTDIASIGLARFIALFSDRVDASRDGRLVLYDSAAQYFMNSPLFGYGIGGVWFTVGYYCHNMFLDILVELGLIGLVLFVVLCFLVVRIFIRELKTDSAYVLMFLFFVCSFVMLQFSGYFWSEPLFIVPLSFASSAFIYPKDKKSYSFVRRSASPNN